MSILSAYDRNWASLSCELRDHGIACSPSFEAIAAEILEILEGEGEDRWTDEQLRVAYGPAGFASIQAAGLR